MVRADTHLLTADLQALEKRVNELEALVAQARSQKNAAGGLSNAERLRLFIGSNIVPIHRADIYGNIFEANEATVKLTGYSKEELCLGGIKWTDFTGPEYRDRDQTAIEQLRDQGRSSFFQKEYIRKDGTRVPVLVHVTAIDDSGEQVIGLVIDLTERKKTEAELKASEAQFRLLAEAVPQIVWILNANGRVSYANQHFYDFSGLRREEDDGLQWLTILHPDDKQRCIDEAKRAYKSGDDFNMELRYRASDGRYKWHLVRALIIQDPLAGKGMWFGTSTDVDDQKRKAEDLQESETQLRTLADAIPQIVFTTKPDGKIIFFNARWFEYTGLTLEQSQDNAWQLLIHPEDLPAYMNEWRNALQTGDSCEMEFRFRSALGTTGSGYRRYLARAVALRKADGQVLKWFATWTEIEGQHV